ncbi:MAG: transposase [Deltaproteobacteria bacterium]|nr:transposase [Deltaproteobacteria bacterium]
MLSAINGFSEQILFLNLRFKNMDIISLNSLAFSEKSAFRYLLGFCWGKRGRFCPDCLNRKLYRLADGRRKCARCGYIFHDFSRRFISKGGLTSRQWLWFLKLFVLEVSPATIAVEMGVGYATIRKAVDRVRRAIVAKALDAPSLYDAGIWPGPGSPMPTREMVNSPVFGIIEVGGIVFCDILPNLTAENLIHFKINFRLKTASIGQIVYTAPFKQYCALVSCGPALWSEHGVRHEDHHLPVDSSPFWKATSQRLRRLRGVSASHFPLYLKESEFRFNAGETGIIPRLAQALCAFVPRVGKSEGPPED